MGFDALLQSLQECTVVHMLPLTARVSECILALAAPPVPKPIVVHSHRCARMTLLLSSRSRERWMHHCLSVPGPARAVAGYTGRRDLCAARDMPEEDLHQNDGEHASSKGAYSGNVIGDVAAPVTAVELKRSRQRSKGEAWAEGRRRARIDEEGEYRIHEDLRAGRMTRFVSRVMYDGTNYCGFQLQSNGGRTIQEVLERTLFKRFQMHVPVLAAGRTDTGVHAVGQAIHFDLPNAHEDLGQLAYSMNQMMPADIRVWNMSLAPRASRAQEEDGLPWSAMINARGKVYSYRLFVGQILSPLDRLYRAHASHAARAPVDARLIREALPLLVGEHNFAGFSNELDKRSALRRAEGILNFNTRRNVYSADFVDEGGGNIRLDFHLDGALYRMVRNMVGTLLAIGAGRFGPEVIEEIFTTGKRDSDRIYPAPAHGLTLQTVLYDEYN